MEKSAYKIHIIGAGISGLIAAQILESKGYKVGSISDSENDIDDDRTWPASVTFFKIYDEKNN